MTQRTLLCDNWEFSKQPYDTAYSDSFSWEKVDIPHDWLIFNTKDLYETSTGWYRRILNYINTGNRTFLRFDGVYMDSAVYVNGSLAGVWKYGYSTFEFEITNLLHDGENLIAVSVNHKSPNSRWYSGAGIFRKVQLVTKPQVHILSDGVYVSTEKLGESWIVRTTAELSENIINGEIVQKITQNGKLLSEKKTAFSGDKCDSEITVSGVKPWDIDSPELCELETVLLVNGKETDCEKVRFGCRTARFTSDKGFFLNERHVKLHGSCEHHDLGALGAAVNSSAIRYRLGKLRKMGINAIRTSHNMPSVELMELADEMGFLVLSEGFDMWEKPKTQYDYARFFGEWAEKDVASWIRRDRNHPSVIGWSIGNEIYDTHESERGLEITKMLSGFVRKYDFRSNAPVTIGSNYMQWKNARKCADFLKVAGYNYGERLYNEHHEKHPDWMIYGSETSSVVHSRGVYHFPLSMEVLSNDDEQCSSLGNCTMGWAAKNTEACIIDDRDAEFCAGQFIWTGFDYIGEPTPYHTKNSYFGQIDTAGFEKDSFYMFKAEWTDYKKDPFVHIFPYWDFNDGEIIDVRVCSNAPKVELFFNGKSQGAFKIDHKQGKKLTADYRIAYEKGTLLARAYDESGTVIAEDVQKSFGDAAKLSLFCEKTQINADGEEVAFVEISASDKDGNFVANANNRIYVEVSGPARLLGLDNGDSTDFEQYKATDRRLFSGKLMAIIASDATAGDIRIKASSMGLESAELTLRAVPATVKEGISCGYNADFSNCPDKNDLPTRTFRMNSDRRVLTPENPTAFVKIASLPEGNNGGEAELRVLTLRNIRSPIADYSEKNGLVSVTAKGNGSFKLRALCKNNDEKYHVISELNFTSEGFETTYCDPYSLVLGGLYSRSGGAVSNGIEKGAEFTDRSFSYIGFENVDFGEFGSDTISVPVFSNSLDPVAISFYDGNPEENGELLGTFEYTTKPIWLTYQPETYKLRKRLRGVHDFYIASDFSFHLKGFSFEKQQKEFSVLYANQAENIYGDGFEIGETAVENILNNVCVELGEVDFTEETPKSVTICGKTPLPVNSVHLKLKGETENRILCEFKNSPDYSEQTFDVSVPRGRYELNVTFLPGTDFGLKWIKFNR